MNIFLMYLKLEASMITLLFIDTVMKPAVTAHKEQRKYHKEYLKYMIERVKEALNALVEHFKLNASKQSTTNNISMKNYAQITKQKPFKPQMKKKTNKSISNLSTKAILKETSSILCDL